MGSSENNHVDPPCVLLALLRHTLSLVEYYGPCEADASTLFELRAALSRAIERLDAEKAARDTASHRKGPHGETIDTTRLDKELDTKL
jgi:hypothetical protein